MVALTTRVSKWTQNVRFECFYFLHQHSQHRDNVTAPHGRPNLRSRLHCCHAQDGGPRSPQGHVVEEEEEEDGEEEKEEETPSKNFLYQ